MKTDNFPWPTPTEAQKAKIENAAQAILDARNLHPDCSLADLYDETTMPVELRRAHHENDKDKIHADLDIYIRKRQFISELPLCSPRGIVNVEFLRVLAIWLSIMFVGIHVLYYIRF